MFQKRTEDELTSETQFVELPGLYKVEVLEAYDTWVAYPESKEKGKSRAIALSLKVIGVIKDDKESDLDYQERHAEIDRITRPRIYLSEKTIEQSSRLLAEIAGNAVMPDDFLRRVTGPDGKQDAKATAEHAPINPANLVGRRFRALLTAPTNGRKGLDLFVKRSWLLPETEQAVGPRDLFEGEDTISYKVRERVQKRNERNENKSRTEGLSDLEDIEELSTTEAGDGFPF